MTRMILVRHAESMANRDQRALGRGDSLLTSRGWSQANNLSCLLRKESLQRIVSSPLQRALCTAQTIAAPHGIVVSTDEKLLELDIGEMEGLTYSKARECFPAVVEGWNGNSGASVRMPNGESLLEVHARAWPCIENIFHAPAPGTVVVVTHNWVIRAILCEALRFSLHDFRRFAVDLASYSVLTLRAGRWELQRFNENGDSRHTY